jgi:single-strand DNA-binding protein
MPRSINKVILLGNLGGDVKTQFSPSGKAVTRFSLATSRSVKNARTNEWEKETNWTNVVVWEREKVAEFLIKGKQVYVEGRLQTRAFDDKEGRKMVVTEVIANDVILLGGKGDAHSDAAEPGQASQNTRSQGRSQAQGARENEQGPKIGITDDDLPW